uniref:Uncharacterized protein n=1 Tax=Timema poppense TaxID=170557 RepID=A0A7R9GUS1_TIMPO|nr:unnamed protein product [Timema poppensis]
MHGGRVESHLGKTTFITPDSFEPRYPHNLIYCDSSALDKLFPNYGLWVMSWRVAERAELLQEAEADETKKSDCQQKHHVIKSGEIGGARASTGGRRRKRDGAYITERQTKGGSLQNIPQEVNAEFDHESSFSYCLRGASGSGTRRKKRNSGSFRDSGVSVSARQREGGSLPSNVDGGSGGMLTLSHLDLPSTSASLRFEEVRHPKLTIPCMRRDGPGYTYMGTNDAATSMTPVRDGESYSGSATSDFMVIEVGNLGLVDHENALEETASGGNGFSRHRKFSGDLSNMKPGDEGIEMERSLVEAPEDLCRRTSDKEEVEGVTKGLREVWWKLQRTYVGGQVIKRKWKESPWWNDRVKKALE